jgi:hypothetical protein
MICYHVASIGLGLLGLSLGGLLMLDCWERNREWGHILSMGACVLAVFCQILEAGRLIWIEDFSALMDTWRAVTLAAGLLIGVTVCLNLTAAMKWRRWKA